MCVKIVRCARSTSVRQSKQMSDTRHTTGFDCGHNSGPRAGGTPMETPKLIITEWNGDAPTSAMCSACRAIFPTLNGNGSHANKRLLEFLSGTRRCRAFGSTSPVGNRARQPALKTDAASLRWPATGDARPHRFRKTIATARREARSDDRAGVTVGRYLACLLR